MVKARGELTAAMMVATASRHLDTLVQISAARECVLPGHAEIHPSHSGTGRIHLLSTVHCGQPRT